MIATALRMTGVISMLVRQGRWNGVVVLSYHRIGDGSVSPLHRGVFTATQELLDKQLTLLARRFELIGPEELEGAIRAGRGRRVMVTFDDGYRDLYEAAFPVLQARGVRALVFVCTGFIDGTATAWWDEIAWMCRGSSEAELPAGPWSSQRLGLDPSQLEDTIATIVRRYWELPAEQGEAFRAALADAARTGRRPPASAQADWMTWDMTRELAGAGHAIGAHTVHHPLLSRLPADAQHQEIAGSVDRIEAELGERPRWLAYPVGLSTAFTRESQTAARRAGIELAFSNYGGRVTASSYAPLDVRRVSAEMLRNESVFAATLAWPSMFVKPYP
ncbi:MAG TPA: polysaccharide deacetylase family protein [Solirubrobacteraceae bacterium]